jgi:hypothetical protein
MKLEQAVTPVCGQTDGAVSFPHSSLLNVFMSMGWDCVSELLPQRAYSCLIYRVMRVAGSGGTLYVSAAAGVMDRKWDAVIRVPGVWRYNSMHSSALDEVSVTFTSRPLYTRYPLDKRLGRPQSRLVRKMESFACARIEVRPSGTQPVNAPGERPVCSRSGYLWALSFVLWCILMAALAFRPNWTRK